MAESSSENDAPLFGWADPPYDPTVLPQYLQKIRHAARRLATNAAPTTATTTDEAVVHDAASTIHEIARLLVQACRLAVISADVTNLPKISMGTNDLGWSIPDEPEPGDEEDDTYNLCPYQMRRVDYLRDLLRTMIPIHWDVAAAVLPLLAEEPSSTAVILFGQWLSVAPHITPLASAVLYTKTCPLVFTGTESPKERFTIVEACHRLCKFFCHERLECESTLLRFWDWTDSAFALLPTGNEMEMDMDWRHWEQTQLEHATHWHAVRIAAYLLNLSAHVTAKYLENFRVAQVIVPWEMHPWDIHVEEGHTEKMALLQKAQIWRQEEYFRIPTAEVVRRDLPLPACLVDCGHGLVLPKTNPIDASLSMDTANSTLIRTASTQKNLSMLAATLLIQPHPPPILVCGAAGAGKSTLIRELAKLVGSSLLEIHVDDETDSKSLIGCTTTTEIPGRFEWRAGALTRAVRQGRWVLLEDLDRVPFEIQAALVQLLESRLLPLGNGQVERAHPNFRLFSTHGPQSTVSRKILSVHSWAQVPIESMSVVEMKEIANFRFSSLPGFILDTVLQIYKQILLEGRALVAGRLPSVRDFFKVLSRISRVLPVERDMTFATESQRTLCLGETMDVFAASCPDIDRRRLLCHRFVAPAWSVSDELAGSYIEKRIPEIVFHENSTELGRVRLPTRKSFERSSSQNFATTGHALRLMESIAVCVRENDPALLVGETGGGKTTLVQQLARVTGRKVVVQNLSLQTDSTDLLGGYRPLEIKHVARRVYQNFVDLFTSTFSRKQNADFLRFAQSALKKEQWKKLSQCFQRAAQLGLKKVTERQDQDVDLEGSVDSWDAFVLSSQTFEQQRLACDSGLAFEFSEGGLVEAIRNGHWVLLDEINLASSEILQRLCGLLDTTDSSIILTERGDSQAVTRHPDFRLFAAMNPATDAGKKDLPPSIRSRFTEIYVDEIVDPQELRGVVGKYLSPLLTESSVPTEETEIVGKVVDLYLRCRALSEVSFVDGAGHKPRYTLRTLSRSLTATTALVISQKFSLTRALVEGIELAFQGCLDEKSSAELAKLIIRSFGKDVNREHPGRRPGGNDGADRFVLLKPFWITRGPNEALNLANEGSNGLSRYVMTPTTLSNIRRLARVVASGPWPILLEGPTSAGKTSVIEYIASRCGYNVVRINNHEHTDIQEYLGAFAPDDSGSLTFQDGLLVRAMRNGDWVILDELNLAPSEVLEALNRLLDDNRELFLAEMNEVVRAHPHFRIFATQNPSGAYGGRKPLSRAFRNRFVEIHVGDIPSVEMVEILEKKGGCPPSHARILVNVMNDLRQRRGIGRVFAGKDSLVTPRDLLRWANRRASTKKELAEEGYMLLAERLRTSKEKSLVQRVIEKHSKIGIDVDSLYYAPSSVAARIFDSIESNVDDEEEKKFALRIAPTKSFLRLVTLVEKCIARKEPVLLVGDTGCGKTTAIQLLSLVRKASLDILNCHATTETSDLLGNLRPIRGREKLGKTILDDSLLLRQKVASVIGTDDVSIPQLEAIAELSPASLHSIATKIKTQFDDYIETTTSKDTKRQKIDGGGSSSLVNEVNRLFQSIDASFKKTESIFEWADGQLVRAMKEGRNFLMDEISLAEDAVIERLNSVLEPSRSLVLAEKTSFDRTTGQKIVAAPEFQLFATMNPGGDFGKRELSPALRSRFTEIWVTPMTESGDIELVLGRLLTSEKVSENFLSPLRSSMTQYLEWFNQCVDTYLSGSTDELSLSVRDLVAWAHFVAEMTTKSNTMLVWDAYFHGALLMHLDGLGLGTVMSLHDIQTIRDKSVRYLHSQVVNAKGSPIDDDFGSITFVRENEKFGSHPFWISEGLLPPASVEYDFTAPTTRINLFRILRAMQLSKPILIEGPPGVGKTTLVTALAEASGHKLVRINLSEQTDMADLIGSDLPTDNNSNNSTSFHWVDGILLAAIKSGDWVLLDELNLASQSVLEGLNSILDHRAEVYIPELAQKVDCPSSFRVFAAQNPLRQGGGRKGLPKSFLNRFTKVFVEALSHDDMCSITTKRYTALGQETIDTLVSFNNEVHTEVSNAAGFGQKGAPWEFNLRDVFRLGLLMHCTETCDLPETKIFIQDLYLKRFRSWKDRKELSSLFEKHFDSSLDLLNFPSLQYAQKGISIGCANLPTLSSLSTDSKRKTFGHVPFSWAGSLEALSRCVENNWPCLLVLNSCPNGHFLIDVLAQIAGANVSDIALTPASDISELIGAYEQVGHSDHIMKELAAYVDALSHLVRDVPEISLLYSKLRVLVCGKTYDDASRCLLWVCDTSAELQQIIRSRLGTIPPNLVKLFHQLQHTATKSESSGNLFAWRDGVLVEAMLNGYWIHLRNVNLCPASVLDRLNSVLEPGGSLLLSECGSDPETGSARRMITPHPNFRAFLSMDPEYGEISRAMRNRCVEISVLPNPDRGSSLWQTDQAGLIQSCGVKSNGLASQIIRSSGLDRIEVDAFCLSILGVTISHGCSRTFCGNVYQQKVGLRLHGADEAPSEETTVVAGVLPPISRRMSPYSAKLDEFFQNLHLLQSLYGWDGGVLSPRSALPSVFQSIRGVKFNENFDGVADLPNEEDLQGYNFVADTLGYSLPDLIGPGEHNAFKTIQNSMGQSMLAVIAECMKPEFSHLTKEYIGRIELGRFITEKVICRNAWVTKADQKEMGALAPLDVSLHLNMGKIDASMINCRVTPFLHPFFLAIDGFMEAILGTKGHNFVSKWHEFDKLMTCLEGMRRILSEVVYVESDVSPFGFPDDMLTVSWKHFRSLFNELHVRCTKSVMEHDCVRNASDLIQQIEQLVFPGGQIGLMGFRQLLPQHPVPKLKAEWVNLLTLRQISEQCVLSSLVSTTQVCVDLPQLLEECHTALIVSHDIKKEIVEGLSTMHAAHIQQTSYFSKGETVLSVRIQSHLDRLMEEAQKAAILTKVRPQDNYQANEMSVGELENLLKLSSGSASLYEAFSELILQRFAELQVAHCYEFVFEKVEQFAIQSLSHLLLLTEGGSGSRTTANKDALCQVLKSLLSAGTTKLQWSLRSISGFQVALWALMSSPGVDENMLQSLSAVLPTLRLHAAQRVWRNSSHLHNALSWSLRLPLISETDTTPVPLPDSTLAPATNLLHSTIFALLRPTGQHGVGVSFQSIENHPLRETQASELARLLVKDEGAPSYKEPWDLTYLVREVFIALSEQLQIAGMESALNQLKSHGFVSKPCADQLAEALQSLSNDTLRELLLLAIPEVLGALHGAWIYFDSDVHQNHAGSVMIWIGLLRYHLYLPDSPVDPSRIPLANAEFLNIKTGILQRRLSALQAKIGLATGEFDRSNEYSSFLSEELSSAKLDAEAEEEKVMQRADNVPPFGSLFHQVHEFAESTMSPGMVSALVHMLQEDPEKAKLELENWFATSKAFYLYVTSKFAAYSEIVEPLMESVATVDSGLKICLEQATTKQTTVTIPVEMFSFPWNGSAENQEKTIHTLQSVGNTRTVGIHRGLLLRAIASLFQLAGHPKNSEDSRAMIAFSTVADWVVNQSAFSSKESGSGPQATTDHEIEEIEYREQFPNHRADFNMQSRDATTDDGVLENSLPSSRTDEAKDFLQEEEIEALCNAHMAAFGPGNVTREWAVRQAFLFQYNAACELSMYEGLLRLGSESYGSQVFALSLSCGYNCRISASDWGAEKTSEHVGFYSQPAPNDAKKVSKPFQELSSRLVWLLQVFPGNEVLLAIVNVMDKIRRLDINAVPIGKIMVGLEAVLKHAQDWEQHSSERTCIGAPLKAISGLVAYFRRCELHSWAGLLSAREAKHQRRARSQWVKLRIMLQTHGDNANIQKSKPPSSRTESYLSPEWLWLNWRGRGARDQCLARSTQDLTDLVKTLDTFLLTASIGEFSTRLSMLGSFASEIHTRATYEASENLLLQARVLSSLHQYYGQFTVFLESYIAKEREPFEERLRNEVKLAKWDEQSYYSLASSSEKNHRKLMVILREYDEVLRTTIATLVEKELQRGVVSENEAQTNMIPALSSLFPTADFAAHPYELERKQRAFIINLIEVTAASPLSEVCSATARYSGKMDTILQKDYHAKKASTIGYEEASDLCSAVFERIESLRTPKATRPMKERSVVDLFKILKDQGYSSSKWNVPEQMRMFGEIVLLPSLSAGRETFISSSYQGNIVQADAYFFRCIAEMNRLNGEARMPSQNYMTQRQIEQMLSFGTHGMLLTAQQRSCLAYMFHEFTRFQKNVQDLCDGSRSLPPEQRKLSMHIRLMKAEVENLCDQLEQLKVLLHEANALGLEPAEASVLSEIQALVLDYLNESRGHELSPNVLILSHHVDCVEKILNETQLLHNHIVDYTSSDDFTVIPNNVVATILHCAMQVIKTGQACSSLSRPLPLQIEEKSLDSVTRLSTELVDYCRLATQVCLKGQEEMVDDETTIWVAHQLSTDELQQLKLERLVETSQKLLEACQDIQNTSVVESLLSCVGTLCAQFTDAVEYRLEAYAAFHRATAKLHYILLRIFRVLIAKGFCTLDSDEKDGDGDGDVSGMKFDDQDGTGMGDGEGSQDVTDQIEDEEQLLGLKGEDDGGAEKEKPGKLDKEEADTGIEMENDFEGDLYDLPSDDEKQVSENEDGDQEEIDREMGDDASPNDEVIDKKLWDGADDEQGNSEDNLDKGGSIEGEVVDDEMITNEDQKTNEESADKQKESAPSTDIPDNASDTGDDDQDQFPSENMEEDTAMNARDDRLQEDAGNDSDDGAGDMELDLEADADINENDADDASAADQADPSIEDTEDAPGPADALDDTGSSDMEDNANDNEGDGAGQDQHDETPIMDAEGAETAEDGPDDRAMEEEHPDVGSNENDIQETYGIQSSNGKDAVKDDSPAEVPAENQGEGSPEDPNDVPGSSNGEGHSSGGPSSSGGSLGTSFNAASMPTAESTKSDAPNPFKSPGDVQKFWHRKLGIVDSQNAQSDDEGMDTQNQDEENANGQFEYVKEGQTSTTQALGEADETNENEMDTQMEDKSSEPAPSDDGKVHQPPRTAIDDKGTGSRKSSDGPTNQADSMEVDTEVVDDDRSVSQESVTQDDSPASAPEMSDMENQVTTDISRMNVDEVSDEAYRSQGIIEDETQDDSRLSTLEAQVKWNTISSEVYGLSRHICEKLRLVLEPLVATKLKGDYRTGKRINMKRVIGYMASGYRKDKIWLRRTKPAKRNYRVMVAVDDSESMAKNGVGDTALRALAALATGMSQLEIGEIGVAKFGNDMQIIHPFGSPFTSESGVNVMKHFQFDQSRTRTALCVESALLALDDAPGEVAPMQLVLLISDGKVERDNKALLRRLVREMLEKNILIVLVIVDGGGAGTRKDSILTMKEVTFENGKPKMRSFMEDYPFPYYIILEDLSTLPETLGDALRQWFEMIGEIQF